MTHAGLFSGIGGFSLAAQWMGWENLFDVEIDPWCRKVLHKNFPTTQLFDDVCTFAGLPFRGRIDVLSGGFPCQPWSDCGLQLGTEDPRHLWPQYLRIIREVQPRVVVGENVRGLLSWGGGIQFEAVCADLEAEGYDVLPLLLPAAGLDAIHKRDRIWFVAHHNGQHGARRQGAAQQTGRPGLASNGRDRGTNAALAQAAANAGGSRCEIRVHGQGPQVIRQTDESGNSGARHTRPGLWPTQPPVLPRNDGLPGRLVRPDRARILKGAGNAIVPQVAVQIFQAIERSASLSTPLT